LYLVASDRMSGEYVAKLRAQVAERGLGESVVFAGTVSPAELVAYYRGATALLTLSDHEGFCIPLLEAMRNDLPIVAHASTAIPDTLGGAGVLLANGHEVRFAGVRHLNDRDVSRTVESIRRGTDAVVIEHEAGIFRDVPFVFALLRLWLRRIPVILSMHELEPEKFHHYRVLS